MYYLVAGIILGFLLGAIVHHAGIQDAKRADYVRYSMSAEEANR